MQEPSWGTEISLPSAPSFLLTISRKARMLRTWPKNQRTKNLYSAQVWGCFCFIHNMAVPDITAVCFSWRNSPGSATRSTSLLRSCLHTPQSLYSSSALSSDGKHFPKWGLFPPRGEGICLQFPTQGKFCSIITWPTGRSLCEWAYNTCRWKTGLTVLFLLVSLWIFWKGLHDKKNHTSVKPILKIPLRFCVFFLKSLIR